MHRFQLLYHKISLVNSTKFMHYKPDIIMKKYNPAPARIGDFRSWSVALDLTADIYKTGLIIMGIGYRFSCLVKFTCIFHCFNY